MEMSARDYYIKTIKNLEDALAFERAERRVAKKTIHLLRNHLEEMKLELAKTRAEFEVPELDPESAEIRKLFPKFPFLGSKLQQLFLIFWRHRNTSKFLSAEELFNLLYSSYDPAFKPQPATIRVHIAYLRRALKPFPLTIEGRYKQGWRLLVLSPSKESRGETENKI